MGRLIGYARVSTAEQDLGLQLAALRSAGCSDAPHFLRYRVGSADGPPRLGGLCPRLRARGHAGGLASRSPRAVDDPFGDVDSGRCSSGTSAFAR